MKTRLTFITFLFFIISNLYAQQNSTQAIQNIDYTIQSQSGGQWFKAKTSNGEVKVVDFFSVFQDALKLSAGDTFQETKERTDKYGWSHHRMQQYHNGVKVLGGEFILHAKDGLVQKANGKIITDIDAPMTATIDAEEAIQAAIDYVAADLYKWDIAQEEAALKRIKKDPSASYYPQAKLVLIDKDYPKQSGIHLLVYMMDVNAEEPLARERIFVDAYHGHIIQSFNTLDHGVAPGVAKTRYNGEQNIITDSVSTDLFILRDSTRGGGIFIANADACTDEEEFIDTDNYWDNENEAQDEVAPDALFALEKAYDYFKERFDLNSYDGEGAEVHCNVHYRRNYNNATWNGTTVNFGDGDGERYNPFPAFDIVVHEFMHAITEYSAALVYRDDSGAINESFSDIFSKIVEYEYLPEKFSWKLGGDIFIDTTDYIRLMNDPNEANDPAFYGGTYWATFSSVHNNSGVMNYWFTLLVDGKADVNEAGNAFDVPALGMDKMSDVCYSMLTNYLTSTSNYYDAVDASVQAASDIFGDCSPEVLAIVEAWYAVGLADPMKENDLILRAGAFGELYCDLSEFEVAIQIINNACNTAIPEGEVIDVYYQVNNEPEVHEQITLLADMDGRDRLLYTFMESITLTEYGEITVKLRVEYANDPDILNNTQEFVFQHSATEDINIDIFTPSVRRDNCGFYEDKYFNVFMSYEKCDVLEGGFILPIRINVDSTDYLVNYEVLDNNINGDFISFTLDMPEGVEGSGEKEFIFEILNENDTDYSDNLAVRNHTLYAPFEDCFLVDFEELDPDWEDNINDGFNAEFTIEDYNGDKKLIATGHEVPDLSWFYDACEDNPEEVFGLNSHVITRVPICVDLATFEEPMLEFDLIQTKGDFNYIDEGIMTEFTVMVRVRASPVGSTSNTTVSDYIINPTMGEMYHHTVDLSELPQEHYIMNIELFAVSAEEGLTKGDNNILDNIEITGCTVPTEEIEDTPQFTIYPNPTDNLFYIETLSQNNLSRIVLFDNTGRVLQEHNVNDTSFTLGETLSPGVYYLKLQVDEQVTYMKLIKI